MCVKPRAPFFAANVQMNLKCARVQKSLRNTMLISNQKQIIRDSQMLRNLVKLQVHKQSTDSNGIKTEQISREAMNEKQREVNSERFINIWLSSNFILASIYPFTFYFRLSRKMKKLKEKIIILYSFDGFVDRA
jgi:hypothetical protein